MSPATNLHSPRRLEALAETCLVNSPPEDSFDRYTRLCSALLEVPVALMVLVEKDRLFFKSRHTRVPLLASDASAPVAHSFCQNVVIEQQAFVVEDCRKDPRTRDSVAVTQHHIRSYAGLPIRNPEGEVLGSFCAVDFQARNWSERELEHLRDLRNGIETEIALRLQVFRLDRTGAELRRHLRAAQQLFANLGHEVRTPLNAMLNLSQACSDLDLPPPADRLAVTMVDSARRLSQLLEGVLDLAALEAGQIVSERGPAQIRPLLATAEAMVTSLERDELSLQMHVEHSVPDWVTIDGPRLVQLLAILIQCHLGRAAWKGKLSLHATHSEPDTLDLRLSCDSYRLSPEELGGLFSYNPDGVEASGLSPTIINSLVDLLTGRLWANCDSHGVHFHLRVPAAPAVPRTLPEKGAERTLKVLAIDDDNTNLCVLDYLTGKLGHQLTTAGSGEEGLAKLAAETYDVLLLDLRMPVMDGFEVARQIRQRGWTLPIVAVTADASETARQMAHSSGMDAFMTKPVKRAELAGMLASMGVISLSRVPVPRAVQGDAASLA